MKVISVPARLRLASSLLLLCVPVAALETIIVTHSPWWHLPYDSIRVWCIAVALITIPIVAWLQAGHRWAYHFALAFAAGWVTVSGGLAVRTHQPAMGFFTLFLIVFFGSLLSWVRGELGRSFFDPKMQWYESVPKPIPGLSCTLSSEKKEHKLRVSRIDAEGLFVFRQDDRAATQLLLPKGVGAGLSLSFRDRQLRTEAFPVRMLRDGRGAGLQFKYLSPDQRKELGEFVEMLRGEGYVD